MRTIGYIGLVGLLCSLGSGCAALTSAMRKPLPPGDHIDASWLAPPSDDLRAAAAELPATLKSAGIPLKLRWVGYAGAEYHISRGPLGLPTREWAKAMFIVSDPASRQCYPVIADLSRENKGGDTYGPAHITGIEPWKLWDTSTQQVRADLTQGLPCAVVDAVKGGLHVDTGAL